MRKTYRTATKLSFPIVLKGKQPYYAKFEELNYGYSTSDKGEQECIENSPHFKRGEIQLFKTEKEEEPEPIAEDKGEVIKTGKQATLIQTNVDEVDSEGLEVTDINGADSEDLEEVTEGIGDAVTEDNATASNETETIEEVIDDATASSTTDVSISEVNVHAEVTDINGAVEVLRGEPYNVAHQSLRTPDAVRKQAGLKNVTFPNWV